MAQISELPLLAIWGTSGHAMVVADIVRRQGSHQIVGFLDDGHSERYGSDFCRAPILGGREQLLTLQDQGVGHLLLAIGDCDIRLELTETLHDLGYCLPVAIHPMAVIAADVEIGPGTVIAAGAVINPGARIGSGVIINTSSSVDHECVIGDAAHICPGAHLAGAVVVGQAAQIGIGAVVIQQIRIGERALIGAGAVVVSDIPSAAVAYGVPARVVRQRHDNTAMA